MAKDNEDMDALTLIIMIAIGILFFYLFYHRPTPTPEKVNPPTVVNPQSTNTSSAKNQSAP